MHGQKSIRFANQIQFAERARSGAIAQLEAIVKSTTEQGSSLNALLGKRTRELKEVEEDLTAVSGEYTKKSQQLVQKSFPAPKNASCQSRQKSQKKQEAQ